MPTATTTVLVGRGRRPTTATKRAPLRKTTINPYNAFCSANAGKRWSAKTMSYEYQKFLARATAAPLTAEGGRYPYKQEPTVTLLTAPKKKKITLANYAFTQGPSRGGSQGTFMEGMFGANPETQRPVNPRQPQYFCSKNAEKFFENTRNDATKPNAWLIFLALHKKCGWMQDKAVKHHNYEIWKEKLYSNPKYAGDTEAARQQNILAKLRRIVQQNHLNPSERLDSFAAGGSSTGQRCPPGANCFYDGTDCIEPRFSDYLATKLNANTLPPAEYRQKVNDLHRQWNATNADDKSKYFRANNFDQMYKGGVDPSVDKHNLSSRHKALRGLGFAPALNYPTLDEDFHNNYDEAGESDDDTFTRFKALDNKKGNTAAKKVNFAAVNYPSFDENNHYEADDGTHNFTPRMENPSAPLRDISYLNSASPASIPDNFFTSEEDKYTAPSEASSDGSYGIHDEAFQASASVLRQVGSMAKVGLDAGTRVARAVGQAVGMVKPPHQGQAVAYKEYAGDEFRRGVTTSDAENNFINLVTDVNGVQQTKRIPSEFVVPLLTADKAKLGDIVFYFYPGDRRKYRGKVSEVSPATGTFKIKDIPSDPIEKKKRKRVYSDRFVLVIGNVGSRMMQGM